MSSVRIEPGESRKCSRGIPNIFRAVAALLLPAVLIGCTTTTRTVWFVTPPRIPVVLDTDIGSDIDDTWALAQLLHSPELDLKMVLCGTGNTVYRARVAAKFLQVAGCTNIPVGIGPSGASHHEYQMPWVQGYDLTNYPGTIHEDGVGAFIELVHGSPQPITLIAIGPVPNIAEALRRDPSIASKVHFVGMHGSIDAGYGGSGTPVPEANVAGDAEAFRAVHAAPWASFKITPLDTCGLVILDGQNYQKLRQSNDALIAALLENYRIWSGLVTWTKADSIDQRSSTLFDTVAVYMVCDGSLLEYESVPVVVTDEGMTLRDRVNGRPIQAALRWKNLDAFYDDLTARLLGEKLQPQAQAH